MLPLPNEGIDRRVSMLRLWWRSRPTHAWALSGALVKRTRDEDVPGHHSRGWGP